MFSKLLAIVIVLSCVSSSHAQTLFQRFAGVKKWELHYSYSGSGPYTWEEGGRTFTRSVYNVASSGKILLEREGDQPEPHFILRGSGPVVANYSERRQETSAGYRSTRYDEGKGTGEVGVDVEMNLEEGTYHLSIIGTKGFPTRYGGTEKWSLTDRKWDADPYDYDVRVPYPSPAQKVLKLPKSGRVIHGSWSHEQELNYAKSEGNFDKDGWFKHNLSAGGVRWMLVPADPTDVELIVEVANHSDWLPRGNRDVGKPGNTLAVKAELVAKKGGGPPQKAVRMTYRLNDVSREKGVCLNWPLTEANTAPDLQFEKEKNADGWTISDEGTTIESPTGDYVQTEATLSSFDFGAFATLLVTAELQDGRVVVGYLKGDEKRSDILLPKRTGDSKIADKWKEITKFSGDDTDDTEKQTGNDKVGDGLTAYEEYRGLMAQSKHTRDNGLLDITRKDLAVLNMIGPVAKPGFALFTSASNIGVVELAEGELPESRQLNINRGVATGGEQYAMLLKEESLNDTAGENRPMDIYNKTPRLSQMAVVDIAGARAFYAQQLAVAKAGGESLPYSVDEDIANTIAHEIAHGVGAPHHGKKTEFDDKRVLTPKMTSWHAYGQDGVELLHDTKDFELKGEIGRPGNDASGDAGCIMTYTNYYAWAAIGQLGMPLKYYAIPPQPVGKHFCTSAAATGFNLPRTLANGKEIPGFFGDAKGQGDGAAVGNCLGTMNVRDW